MHATVLLTAHLDAGNLKVDHSADSITVPRRADQLDHEPVALWMKLTATILEELSFMASYSLVSVGNIEVYRNRQILEPNYLFSNFLPTMFPVFLVNYLAFI